MSEIQAKKILRGIACPSCGSRQLHVQYTRHRSGAIVRVRRCLHCDRRIVTYERMAGSQQVDPLA